MKPEIIKCYRVSPYNKPWTTKVPNTQSCFESAYFLKTEDGYFMLACLEDMKHTVEDLQ